MSRTCPTLLGPGYELAGSGCARRVFWAIYVSVSCGSRRGYEGNFPSCLFWDLVWIGNGAVSWLCYFLGPALIYKPPSSPLFVTFLSSLRNLLYPTYTIRLNVPVPAPVPAPVLSCISRDEILSSPAPT